jgi:serine/threonine-protein kinase
MIAVQTGSQLDHYRIEGVVARSGMASIFRGTDLRSGSAVAIKVPHPVIASDPQFLENFRHEEEICQRLDHPSVVKILADYNPNRTYMVMEWVPGRSLRQVIQAQPRLPQERATRLTISICDALEYIHACGVVHRDLKPENVMVDGHDRIKLIDFGIAGSHGASVTPESSSEIMGSPHYISPEQVAGNGGDGRSDIYALGVILYEMLTGETPFRGTSSSSIMKDRLLSYPIPPRNINNRISPQLQEILYRALERDPGRRYSLAREFASDLRHESIVRVAQRPELRDWKARREPLWKRIALYGALASVPIPVFGLLLYIARHI